MTWIIQAITIILMILMMHGMTSSRDSNQWLLCAVCTAKPQGLGLHVFVALLSLNIYLLVHKENKLNNCKSGPGFAVIQSILMLQKSDSLVYSIPWRGLAWSQWNNSRDSESSLLEHIWALWLTKPNCHADLKHWSPRKTTCVPQLLLLICRLSASGLL